MIDHNIHVWFFICPFDGKLCFILSIQVKVGDTLDLILMENRDANTVTLRRVVVRKVFAESSSTEKHKVALRRWKSLELSKDEAFKL